MHNETPWHDQPDGDFSSAIRLGIGLNTHGPGTSRPFASESPCYHLWSLRFRRRDRALTAGPGCHGSSSTEMGAPGTSTTAVHSTSNQHSPRARIVSRVGVMSRFRMKPSLLLLMYPRGFQRSRKTHATSRRLASFRRLLSRERGFFGDAGFFLALGMALTEDRNSSFGCFAVRWWPWFSGWMRAASSSVLC